MNENQTEKLHGLLKHFATGVLITQGNAVGWHARPMALASVTAECEVWFITGEDTIKVSEIEADARALVVCQDGWSSCVTVTGRAVLVRDRAMIQRLWKPAFRSWFPQGADDPNIVLIRVTGEQGEYWDNKGLNRLACLYQSVQAVATGSTPEVKEGEQHGHVSLTPR